jgi:hypothetical protein
LVSFKEDIIEELTKERNVYILVVVIVHIAFEVSFQSHQLLFVAALFVDLRIQNNKAKNQIRNNNQSIFDSLICFETKLVLSFIFFREN